MTGEKISMEYGYRTDKGRIRENNEDALKLLKQDKVFIIADGVGGNNSGDVASRTAVDGIYKYIEENPLEGMLTPTGKTTMPGVKRYFRNCFNKVNELVLDKAVEEPQNAGMATTLVVVYFAPNATYVMNIGDSRAYLFRGGKLRQITEDHTYVNTLLKAGLITEKEAETHKNKHMITRAVGAERTVRADYFVLDAGPGDIIMMCTDGLYGAVAEDVIAEKLGEDKSMDDICGELIDLANANGGYDNITVVCMKITEDDINE